MSSPVNGPTTPRREPAPGAGGPVANNPSTEQQGAPQHAAPPEAAQGYAAPHATTQYAPRDPAPHSGTGTPALAVRDLTKFYGQSGRPAADHVNLTVPRGSFYGLVGRNGAGKTTTLSMATGLLRPSAGSVLVGGGSRDELVDVWRDPVTAKRRMGVLPDGAHLFDRLTGRQLVTYSGLLRGMDRELVAQRTEDLIVAMDLQDAAGRQVQDYSAGMTKKIALAAAMIHAPSLLVLDEPFESVDPVSAANIRSLLHQYTNSGGTVVVSSHVMDLVQRMCDHVAVMDQGRVLAQGTMDEVCAGMSLEDRFVSLVGGRTEAGEGLQWLRPE
ncbi:ATP-binding cassette domain-containing protein [Kocuria marina subsp. indica]|uniref:ABC transporter ATP-binding protein n=1 Tax=Kocuria TaxID=57493 RepID=UPI0010395F6A|nr:MULTISPECIES: ABC transporter ATP-binding protein [Kocuria]MDT0119462.1 ATP-binding cassette domain-containing protein [Kocuria sp. PD6]QBJ21255.1 ATP-binding cassette domain-containing protein [Kocuria indica]